MKTAEKSVPPGEVARGNIREGMRSYKLLVYNKFKGCIVQHGKHKQHFITTISRVNLDCTPVIYIILYINYTSIRRRRMGEGLFLSKTKPFCW